MTAIQNDLGRNVFWKRNAESEIKAQPAANYSTQTWRSAESPRLEVPTALQFLREAEVHQLHVAGHVEKQIFGLKISAKNEDLNDEFFKTNVA